MSLQNRAQIDLILVRLRALEVQVSELKKRLEQPTLEKFVHLEAAV